VPSQSVRLVGQVHIPAAHDPPLHPWPQPPQLVRLVWVLTQTFVHDVKPVAHPHVPLLHVMLSPAVPHARPLATGPLSVQVCIPVAHEVVPAWQGFGGLPGVQLALAVQDTHVPALQTSLLPHVAPFAAFAPVSTHVEAPVLHDVSPVWHGLAGVQAVPAVQATHDPDALHTWLVAHDVPVVTLTPVSTHTDVPVLHDVSPAWHALAGVHAVPDVHAKHDPLSHAMPLPQLVPLGTL